MKGFKGLEFGSRPPIPFHREYRKKDLKALEALKGLEGLYPPPSYLIYMARFEGLNHNCAKGFDSFDCLTSTPRDKHEIPLIVDKGFIV